jgi:EAL domain-containing protein (putative c-di-GMP-specific phosphodiesterase class I)
VLHDPTARKICHAVIGIARALLLVPIAPAVDTPAQRRTLLSIGCEQGSGDYFKSTNMTALAPTSRHFSLGS